MKITLHYHRSQVFREACPKRPTPIQIRREEIQEQTNASKEILKVDVSRNLSERFSTSRKVGILRPSVFSIPTQEIYDFFPVDMLPGVTGCMVSLVSCPAHTCLLVSGVWRRDQGIPIPMPAYARAWELQVACTSVDSSRVRVDMVLHHYRPARLQCLPQCLYSLAATTLNPLSPQTSVTVTPTCTVWLQRM